MESGNNETIDLCWHKLHDEIKWDLLFEKMDNCKEFLLKLNLCGSQIISKFEIINKHLINLNSLTILDLSHNHLTFYEIKSLSDNFLSKNKTLLKLDLTKNEIMNEGANYLFETIKQSNRLQTLSLTSNKIKKFDLPRFIRYR